MTDAALVPSWLIAKAMRDPRWISAQREVPAVGVPASSVRRELAVRAWSLRRRLQAAVATGAVRSLTEGQGVRRAVPGQNYQPEKGIA